MPSKLDAVYRSLLLGKFFTKGWGKPQELERLFEFRKIMSNREACYNLIDINHPVEITKEESSSDYTIIEGKFKSPLEMHLPGLVPEAARDAHFQMILPKKWESEDYKPVCVHLAGTGDHYYWRRRNLIAKPLLKEANLGAIILENPFYGRRKPQDQIASALHNVSDIFVMGGCLILESLVLFNWCEQQGLGPLGITGLSMGGHMASLAASNFPKPLVLVPCLSWSTASSVFTEGVMSYAINWDLLETQYYADGQYREKLMKMVTVVDEAFIAGKYFIKNFEKSMKELREDIKDTKKLTLDFDQMNKVNLECVNDTNPDYIKNKFLHINGRSNKLNLSEELLGKLLSNEKCELTALEINELNNKIRIALDNMKKDGAQLHFLKEEQAKFLVMDENSHLVGIPDKIQSDTSSNDSSTMLSSAYNLSRTKLMNIITQNDGSKSLVPPKEKFEIGKTNWWEREASQFMRGIMDECTHLKNFSVPFDTDLIIAVCAKEDAYVPREGCSSLEDIWPGAEVKYIDDAGHVSAYVLHQKLFRKSIIEAFERSKKKWMAEKEAKKNEQTKAIAPLNLTENTPKLTTVECH